VKSVVGINLPNSCNDIDVTKRYLSSFAASGFDSAEVCLDTYPLIVDGQISEPWVNVLDGVLKEFPLSYSAHIGRGLDLRDLSNKEKHWLVFKSSIDICARLGMSPLVIHYEVQGKNQAVEKYFLQAHKDAADYAGSKGVLLVVENIEVELVKPVVELVAEVDSKALRLAFDTGHAFLASSYFNFDFLEAFKSTLPYLAHLHLSDNTGTFEPLRILDRPKYDYMPMGYRFEYGRGDIHLPPYFGKIPYDTLFETLFSSVGDFNGMFICEYYVERFFPFGEMVQKRVRSGISSACKGG
jgi:sugar phosphate isomerase/epimerase